MEMMCLRFRDKSARPASTAASHLQTAAGPSLPCAAVDCRQVVMSCVLFRKLSEQDCNGRDIEEFEVARSNLVSRAQTFCSADARSKCEAKGTVYCGCLCDVILSGDDDIQWHLLERAEGREDLLQLPLPLLEPSRLSLSVTWCHS